MKITKYEQSGFIIETDNGYKLAIDIGAYTPIEKLNNISVDVMLVSHIHGDHFSLLHIDKLSPKKIYLNKECIDMLGDKTLPGEIIKIKVGDIIDINGIKVLAIFNVDHGPNTKVRPIENMGFLLEIDNKKIYFAGDMFYSSGIDTAGLEVDYALIPIGGFYTFGPEEAVSFLKQFKSAGEVIPMHYEKTPETKKEFEKEVEKIKVESMV